MSKQLFRVTAEVDLLVWAENGAAARHIAAQHWNDEERDPDFSDRRIYPEDMERYASETPYGAGVPVRLLMSAGEEADHDHLKACWMAPFGEETWFTDGYSVFPARPRGWLLDDRHEPTKDLDKVFAGQIKAIADGTLPAVAFDRKKPEVEEYLGTRTHLFRASDGWPALARYVIEVHRQHPEATWHHADSREAFLAVAGGKIVAIVLPCGEKAAVAR